MTVNEVSLCDGHLFYVFSDTLSITFRQKVKTRIQSLLKTLSEGVYEKDTELSLGLLAALAGESLLLLGPPGVAKSMVARRLKSAFVGARSFEYLMSRFATPDEIFGPVSISRLKESDCYERAVDGYLPTADIVFLDEIWKAGPAIQNTLLTVINEKTYLNGNRPMQLPLKLLIAASNELPVQGEGLEALWDRFLIRLVSGCIESEENFYRMVRPTPTLPHREGESKSQSEDSDMSASFTSSEYASIQQQIAEVEIPHHVLLAITHIRHGLKDVAIEGQDVHRNIYVSDRRWKKVVHLMCASAYVHDRKEVNLADLQLAIHCLWNEPDEIESIGLLVARAIFNPYLERLDALSMQLGKALRVRKVKDVLEDARQHGDHRDDDLIVFDGLYYAIDERSGVSNAFIYVPDFKRLPTRSTDEPAARGVMYRDPRQPKRQIIRAFTNPDNVGEHEVEFTRVNLYRDSMNLYVNGTRYGLRRALRGANNAQQSGLEPVLKGALSSLEDCETAVDHLFQEAVMLGNQLKTHLFVSKQVLAVVNAQLDTFRKQIAMLRADVRKLLYDE